MPPGVYQVNRHIIVDNVTIRGAGSWYTIISGKQVTLTTPLPDGSVHTGVGFYGKDAGAGGSSNVHLSGFAIEGDVRERIDPDQVNGIGGALSNSTIDGLYIHHTKVGMWLDGPMDEPQDHEQLIVDQIADGINFHTGVTDSPRLEHLRPQHRRRRPGDVVGDDGGRETTPSITTPCRRPTLANGIAIYGGTDNTVSNNLVADPIREGSGIQVGSRFGAEAFTGHALDHRTTRRSAPEPTS